MRGFQLFMPLPAENHPLLAAFAGLNARPQSVILISHENASSVLARPKGALPVPAESKVSVQVKKPAARKCGGQPGSTNVVKRFNLVLAEMTG
jgi:hypothetical protein